jgi:membrane-bound serine protease (ClpP class)
MKKTGNSPLKWLALSLAVVAASLAAFSDASAHPVRAQSTQPEVVILDASGPIGPALAGYIARGINEADARNAEAVILQLDTPGGDVNVTLGIIQDIRNADVPVIVYVGPPGARAASAGLLVTLAGHLAAMAPDTAIGASSPVGPQGQDLPETEQAKIEGYLSAQARSLAERRGADAVEVANAAVVDAKAVSANEALSANLVDFIARDTDDLLAQLNGAEVEVNGRTRTLNTSNPLLTRIPMNQVERILLILTDPNIVFTLLSFGVVAIIVEIRSPGGWVAGAFGTIALGLSLYGLGVLPVNWLGLVFIILAFVLFILDIKAPTHGALSAAAVASLAAGAFILFSQPGIAPFGHLSVPLVIGQSLLIGGIFAFLVMMAVRAQTLQPTTGYEGLSGQVGRVTRDLDPEGMVQVWGERWRARAVDNQVIPSGSEVEVVEAGKMRLLVRPARSRQPGQPPGE